MRPLLEVSTWSQAIVRGGAQFGQTACARGATLLLIAALCACAQSTLQSPARPPELEPDASVADAGGAGTPPEFPETGINASTLTVTASSPQRPVRGRQPRGRARQRLHRRRAGVLRRAHGAARRTRCCSDRNSLQRRRARRAASARPTCASRSATRASTLEDAYDYSPLLLEPISGSIAGGTSVLITRRRRGLRRRRARRVRRRARAPTCAWSRRTRCAARRRKGAVGAADVRRVLARATRTARGSTRRDAFEYLDLTDTDHGGLSGGAIDGHAQRDGRSTRTAASPCRARSC